VTGDDRTLRIDADRGASEVVSFVLAFALITTTAGVVFVTGIGGLQNARDAEQLQNAERAFDVVDDNLLDHHAAGAPTRATEIKLNDATLELGGDRDVVVTVEVTNVGASPNASTRITPIVYSPTDSPDAIVYSNGAVLRSQQRGAAMNDGPPIVVREDGTARTAVIPFVQTRARGGASSVAGSSTVLLRTDLALKEVVLNRTDGDDIQGTPPDRDGDGTDEYNVTYTVNTTATRAPAWERHLEERFAWVDDACTVPAGSPGSVECSFYIEELYVTATRIDASISR